jgi:hypothetical protein
MEAQHFVREVVIALLFTRAKQVCQIGREKDLEIVQAGIYKRQAIRTFRRNSKGYHVRLFPNPDRCHGRAHAAARAYLLRMHGSACIFGVPDIL